MLDTGSVKKQLKSWLAGATFQERKIFNMLARIKNSHHKIWNKPSKELFNAAYFIPKYFASQVSKPKPLIVMLPWLGATKQAISKYSHIYKDVGCDVIIKESKVIDFLQPKVGLKNSRKHLTEIKQIVESNNCPVIFHTSSIGCYFYTLMLTHLNNNPVLYSKIIENTKAQVLDSPVIGTLNEMAVGVSTVTVNNEVIGKVLKNAVLLYFAFTKPFTVKIYNQLIDEIKFRPLKVPTLLMSSDNDPMALPEAFTEFVEIYRSQGMAVTDKSWTNSAHVQHLKFHPTLYKQMIYKLLSDALGDSCAQLRIP